MKTYIYIGAGRGVPGLPHTMTEYDVLRLGVEKELADALKANQYKVQEDSTSVWDAPKAEPVKARSARPYAAKKKQEA